ncbi:unnamed protein product [Discosporangium mesarthrocarpum]
MMRVLNTHDVLLSLAALIENPSWMRRLNEVRGTLGWGG